jgi:hypothetical protein
MVSRQSSDLYATVVDQCVGTNQEGINWLLRKARKDHIDVTTGIGWEDLDPLPNGRGRSPDV